MTRLRIAFVGFMLAIGLAASVVSIGRAQLRETIPLPEPVVVSGNDVGFRIEGQQGDVPVGKLVVRIKGQWVEAMVGGLGTRPVVGPSTGFR